MVVHNSHAITGVGFQPDLGLDVNQKTNASYEQHALFDSVRGIKKILDHTDTTEVIRTNTHKF